MDSTDHSAGYRERAGRVLGFELNTGDGIAAGLIFVSLLAFFAPVIFGGEVFYFRDICQEIVPKRWFFAHSGLEALWNPYSFFGLPHAANSQSSVFYPLNFLFYLGSTPRMVSIYIMLHFVIALASTYVLVRARKGSPAASVIGALAFAYGGFFSSLGNQVVVLNSAAWIMALLWSADRAFVTGRKTYIIGVGAFWALQVLGGEPEIAYLSGLILALHLLARSLELGAEFKRTLLGKRAILILGGGLLLALALSAVQWLLSLELTELSNRAHGVPYSEAVKWSLEPRALFTLFFPHYIMNATTTVNWVLGFQTRHLPYLLSIYPGIIVLGLALIGAARGARSRWIFAMGALFFLWLSLGHAGGLYRAAHLILPGFDRFRFPERCLFGFSGFFALLAAGGLDSLIEWFTKLREKAGVEHMDARRFWILILMLSALIAVLLIRQHGLVLKFLELESWPVSQILDDLAAQDQARTWLIAASILRTAAIAVLCLILILITGVRFSSRRGLIAALSLCLFLDLYLAHRFVMPTVEPGFYSLEQTVLDELPENRRSARGLIFAPPQTDFEMAIDVGVKPVDKFRKFREWLLPFVSLELGVHDVLAKSSFYPADYDLYKSLVEGKSQAVWGKLFSISGVNWIIRIQPGPEVRAAQNAMPRAYVVPEARWFKDRESLIKAMLDPGFDPRKEVLLIGEPPSELPPERDNLFWPMKDADRIIVEDGNQRVSVLIEPQHPGWLVLLDLDYPGWKARLNGEEQKIYRANGFFRAIPVGAEGGVAEFSYWPPRFFAGLLISLSALLFCLIVLFWPRSFVLFWPLWFLILVILPTMEGGTTHVPVGLLRISVLIMAAAWTWKLMREKELRLFRTRLDIWIAGFWLLAGISLIRSAYFFISFQWCLNIVTYILLFYFTVQFTSGEEKTGTRRLYWIMGIALVGALFESVWAVIEWQRQAGQASAGYFNPSFLAGSLMVTSPYLLARGMISLHGPGLKKALAALGWFFALLMVILGMVAAQSRALVILPILLVIVTLPGLEGVLRSRGVLKKRARKIAAVSVIALLALAALLTALVPNPVRDRIRQQRKDPYSFERLQIWRSSVKMIADHPLGVGLGMYKYFSSRYKFPVEKVMAGRYEKEAKTAHNEYLHLAAEMSPAAVLFLLVGLALILWPALKTKWASPPGILMIGLAAGLIAIALHSLLDSNLHEPSIAVLAAVISGLLITELSRQGVSMTLALSPGRGIKIFLVILFAGLLVAGAPGYVYLTWSFDHTVKAMKEKELTREIVLLDRAVKHSFGNATPYNRLALAMLRQYYFSHNARDLEKARIAAEEASALNPADSTPLDLKGRVFMELFKASKEKKFLDYAETALSRARDLDPLDIDALLAQAEIANYRGDHELERSRLERALELEPYDLGARLRLCRALLDLGRDDEAKEQWRDFQKRKQEVDKMKKNRPGFFNSSYRARRVAGDPALEELINKLLPAP